tara:strand:- start:329 stop:475 length:147 start_codon:yes stop_codon:yes gene_type:complete
LKILTLIFSFSIKGNQGAAIGIPLANIEKVPAFEVIVMDLFCYGKVNL